MPDLDLGGWTVYGRHEDDPDVVKIELYVKNIGAGDAGGFSVETICSGRLSRGVVDGLQAGSTTTIELEFSLKDPDDLAPQLVLLDPTNTVLESNETNNARPFDDPACQV